MRKLKEYLVKIQICSGRQIYEYLLGIDPSQNSFDIFYLPATFPFTTSETV